MLSFDSSSPRNIFRRQRFAVFSRLVDEVLKANEECRIVDIGGRRSYWHAYGTGLDWKRVRVHVVNLERDFGESGEDNDNRISFAQGDARDLSAYPCGSFDVAHSNSVIEHVGLFREMARMAREVRRIAPRYFVQTPNYWFPFEPHARAPFFHFLPEPVRASLILSRQRGWMCGRDIGEATEAAQSAIMLTRAQMRFLFPEARVVAERAFGLTKSLMAVR